MCCQSRRLFNCHLPQLVRVHHALLLDFLAETSEEGEERQSVELTVGQHVRLEYTTQVQVGVGRDCGYLSYREKFVEGFVERGGLCGV